MENSLSQKLTAKLTAKHVEIKQVLRESGHNTSTYQYHLDKGSLENVYWHQGYVDALEDMLRLLAQEEEKAQPKNVPAEEVQGGASVRRRVQRLTPNATGGLPTD